MNSNGNAAKTKTEKRRNHFACTDWWLVVVWMAWAVSAGASAYQWQYGAVWLPALLVLLTVLLTVVALYLTVTRRAWRVVLDRAASSADRRAAIRIAWAWHGAAQTIYDPMRNKLTGDYWYPGLHGFKIDDDGLIMGVLMPRGVHYDRTVWEKPATNHDMADTLQVDDVRDPLRRGNMVTYLVVPVDVTEDTRHA